MIFFPQKYTMAVYSLTLQHRCSSQQESPGLRSLRRSCLCQRRSWSQRTRQKQHSIEAWETWVGVQTRRKIVAQEATSPQRWARVRKIDPKSKKYTLNVILKASESGYLKL